jgi:hypothetical protein
MSLDPYRIVVFLHVLLFVYWLGADLGVFICSTVGRSRKLTDDQRLGLREAGELIDMAPRTCLVLMVPVGLTLAANLGSPLRGAPVLTVIWLASLVWLWLVWQVHLQHNSPLGRRFWQIDFGVRGLVMAGFVGFGAWCLATGGPIASRWLAAKILLFGLIILCGIAVRIPAPVVAACEPGSGRRRVGVGGRQPDPQRRLRHLGSGGGHRLPGRDQAVLT